MFRKLRLHLEPESAVMELEGVGPVLFEKSKRAKRLNISVKPLKGVRVAVPYWLSFKKAMETVRPRADWIKRHQTQLKRLKEKHEAYSSGLAPLDKKGGREKIVCRLDELAEKHGFTYNRVFVRNQKTRWGSCSSRNNINLNIKLARLSDDLIDYVILHELVHTIIKNHGKTFWSTMDSLTGDAKAVDSRLNRYRLELL